MHPNGYCDEHDKLRMLCCPVCFEDAVNKRIKDVEAENQRLKAEHEQYREWAAGQIEQLQAKLAEAESLLSDNEHLDARIERYFEAKGK